MSSGNAASRLVLLGTAGGPTPKLHRSAPAQAVCVGDRTYVVDAGNGVARQMRRAGIPFPTLRTVHITHHHSDHVADLGTLLWLAWGADLDTPVDIFGPPPLTSMLTAFFEFSRNDIETRVVDEGRSDLRDLVTPHEVTGPAVVFEDDRVRITAAPVEHPPMLAYAYRVDTDDRSYVISGDTRPCAGLVSLATGADVLVHEVIHLPSLDFTLGQTTGSRLREHLVDSHTSVDHVGKIAEDAGVGTLVLSHLVPSDAPISAEEWTTAARQGFSGRVILGEDLMEIQ